MKMKYSIRLVRNAIGVILMLAGMALIPHRWCARESASWYQGDAGTQEKLANQMDQWIHTELKRENFRTGNDQFNGEWLFGTYMMAAMGYGQMALEHPKYRTKNLERMEHCIQLMLSEKVRAFDKESWQSDPIEELENDLRHHAAYLGYLNLVLGLHRLLEPQSKYAPLNDRITAALVRRLEKSSILLLQTYPMEIYPVDNCAIIGSIGLYDRATGSNHQKLLERWFERIEADYIDPQTGILYQAVNLKTGEPIDAPRGSGTCFGAYFLSFADISFSRKLHEAVQRNLAGRFLGFGVVREYPRGHSGHGDIDSGPIILGYSISATGFSLGNARIHGDFSSFWRLYSTACLFGAPREREERFEFVTGGPIGNAILFAMLTAQPHGTHSKENHHP